MSSISCTKRGKAQSNLINGEYSLVLPSLNQVDRIVIDGMGWNRYVSNIDSKKTLFFEAGAVSEYHGDSFILEDFTIRLDVMKPASEAIEVSQTYSQDLKMFFDDCTSPAVIFYDSEYGYIYSRN